MKKLEKITNSLFSERLDRLKMKKIMGGTPVEPNIEIRMPKKATTSYNLRTGEAFDCDWE